MLLSSIGPVEDAPALPRRVQGGGACPPEDFGGIERYAYMLNIFADESHRLHDEVVEWFGEDFDPAHFDSSGRPSLRGLQPPRRATTTD